MLIFLGIFPKGAGTGATRIAGRPPGDLAKPAGQVVDTPQMRKVRRQGDSPAKAPPKISPETIAAAKTARDCFCAAPAMKTVQPCITSGCASAPDGGAAAVKGINAACKAVVSYPSQKLRFENQLTSLSDIIHSIDTRSCCCWWSCSSSLGAETSPWKRFVKSGADERDQNVSVFKINVNHHQPQSNALFMFRLVRPSSFFFLSKSAANQCSLA